MTLFKWRNLENAEPHPMKPTQVSLGRSLARQDSSVGQHSFLPSRSAGILPPGLRVCGTGGGGTKQELYTCLGCRECLVASLSVPITNSCFLSCPGPHTSPLRSLPFQPLTCRVVCPFLDGTVIQRDHLPSALPCQSPVLWKAMCPACQGPCGVPAQAQFNSRELKGPDDAECKLNVAESC